MRVATFSTHTGKHRLSTNFPNAVPTYCGCFVEFLKYCWMFAVIPVSFSFGYENGRKDGFKSNSLNPLLLF
jgi:hypothetical protein